MKRFLLLILLLCNAAIVRGETESSTTAIEQTLSIIKPDAVASNQIGAILSRFENAGLCIVAAKMMKLTQAQAEGFYAEHKERPFFQSLVTFMTSGPVFVSVLQGKNAILLNRELMGPTDAKGAPKGTLRGDFGTDKQRNAVHGSDSPESAKREIAYFFSSDEIFSR